MNHINDQKRKTDLAWEQLYTRLEADGLLSDTPELRPATSLRIRAVSWAAVFALLCVSLVTIYRMRLPEKETIPLISMQNTENATTLVTTLEDGSVVFLAENAVLQYPEHFDPDKREVRLEGNARFDVSGNKQRPFRIETQTAHVEVLGTSFEIRNEADQPFELIVREGEVKVTSKNDSEVCIVRAGEKVQLMPDGMLIGFTEDNRLEDSYAKRLRFKDEKLSNILNILNKKMDDTPLVLSHSLEDRTLNIAFEFNTPSHEIAELICTAFDLHYKTYNDKIVISMDQ